MTREIISKLNEIETTEAAMSESSQKFTGKHARFDVYLNDEHIDSVFYDASMHPIEVKRSLIDHDGYDPNIDVILNLSEDDESAKWAKHHGFAEYNVLLNGTVIDTVYYDDGMKIDDIKRHLVTHDKYDPRITIKKTELLSETTEVSTKEQELLDLYEAFDENGFDSRAVSATKTVLNPLYTSKKTDMMTWLARILGDAHKDYIGIGYNATSMKKILKGEKLSDDQIAILERELKAAIKEEATSHNMLKFLVNDPSVFGNYVFKHEVAEVSEDILKAAVKKNLLNRLHIIIKRSKNNDLSESFRPAALYALPNGIVAETLSSGRLKLSFDINDKEVKKTIAKIISFPATIKERFNRLISDPEGTEALFQVDDKNSDSIVITDSYSFAHPNSSDVTSSEHTSVWFWPSVTLKNPLEELYNKGYIVFDSSDSEDADEINEAQKNSVISVTKGKLRNLINKKIIENKLQKFSSGTGYFVRSSEDFNNLSFWVCKKGTPKSLKTPITREKVKSLFANDTTTDTLTVFELAELATDQNGITLDSGDTIYATAN